MKKKKERVRQSEGEAWEKVGPPHIFPGWNQVWLWVRARQLRLAAFTWHGSPVITVPRLGPEATWAGGRAADTHSVVKANPGSLSLQKPSAVEEQEPRLSDVTADTWFGNRVTSRRVKFIYVFMNN